MYKDAEELDKIETKRRELYEKTKDLKHAEVIGIVGSSFKPFSPLDADQIDANIDASYSFDPDKRSIVEGTNYENEKQIQRQRTEDARRLYKPNFYKNSSAWFYDTPGILGSQEILRWLFSHL